MPACLLIFDSIVIKGAGNKDTRRKLNGFDFGLLTLELLGPGQLPSYLRAIQNILMNLFACSQVNKSMYFWLLVIIQYGFIKAGTLRLPVPGLVQFRVT